jgi:hypothetical protein
LRPLRLFGSATFELFLDARDGSPAARLVVTMDMPTLM